MHESNMMTTILFCLYSYIHKKFISLSSNECQNLLLFNIIRILKMFSFKILHTIYLTTHWSKKDSFLWNKFLVLCHSYYKVKSESPFLLPVIAFRSKRSSICAFQNSSPCVFHLREEKCYLLEWQTASQFQLVCSVSVRNR